MLPSLFDICVPKQDVLRGTLADSDFAADLAQVLRGEAADEYQNPASFFANTHPTRGLRNLLSNVCLRLSGSSEQIASIFRLDTNYGGGKTHALIALAHIAKGEAQKFDISEFLDPKLLPSAPVRVAAFDGENADPVNGHAVGNDIRAYTPWGELAYALGGTQGYELLRKSDEQRVAPGADTIKELIAGKPTLFLIDELSIYLRKQEAVDLSQAAKQLTAFLTALFKAVESSPCTALVYTLAIGKKDGKATDAYSQENEAIAQMMQEAESISARKATLLDPTEEDETVKVLRRRLFSSIDDEQARTVVDAYARLWEENREYLPQFGVRDTSVQDFYEGYPLHPELVATLREKTSTLGNFQRVRGMLRLLARSVGRLWQTRPEKTSSIHLHHIDLSFGPIRQEFVIKLGQKAFVPAMKADIAASAGDAPSLAERMDADQYTGIAPYASFVAKTIFLHSLAFNDNLKGAGEPELRFSILAPDLDISFINDAIRKFRLESAYLDERPNAPLRFLVEPNLNQLIYQKEKQIDPMDVRTRLNDEIRKIFSGKLFEPVLFPSQPTDVADDDGKPKLVVIAYEAASIRPNATPGEVPPLVEKLFLHKSNEGIPRIYRNNLVFLLAEENRIEDMKSHMRRRLALEDMKNSPLEDLAPHQKAQLSERHKRSEMELAVAIQQTYRCLFFPNHTAAFTNDRGIELKKDIVELENASAKPGSGQNLVERILHNLGKYRRSSEQPDSLDFVKRNTPLKNESSTTIDLWHEYLANTNLNILQSSDLIKQCIKNGIESKKLVYKKGDLVYCGEKVQLHEIEISDKALVLTIEEAEKQKIWPVQQPVVENENKNENENENEDEDEDEDLDTNGGSDNKKTRKKTPQIFTIDDAVLKQALIEIFERVEQKKCNKFNSIEICCYTWLELPKLTNVLSRIKKGKKNIYIECSFETKNNSSYDINFKGTTSDIIQIQQFLNLQLRVAEPETITFRVRIYIDYHDEDFSIDTDSIKAFKDYFTPAEDINVSVKVEAMPLV